jgi:hypothetical protein
MNNRLVLREPAEETVQSCKELVTNFFPNKSYPKKFEKAMLAKKVLTIKDKIMRIEYPKLAWINRAKKSFNVSMKLWNNKNYPSFYLSQEDEVINIAQTYAKSLEKEINNELDDQATKNLDLVRTWIKSYQGYEQELDQLTEERISLQYNLAILKKMDLENKDRDIQLNFKKNGATTTEVFTLHKEDFSAKSLIGNLKNQITDLDGGIIRDGKIKERIIRQAMLQDMLTIVDRELEHHIKNTEKVPADLQVALKELNNTLKNKEFSPSTYGVYKITNKIFISELMSLSKLENVFATIKNPAVKLKNILSNFLENNNNDKEKLGFFSRLYARITSITPKQVAVGGSVVATAGFGTYRYFWYSPEAQLSSIDSGSIIAHQVQYDNTQKVIEDKNDSYSKAIEDEIDFSEEKIQK